jgi:hypothetical protein
MVTLFFCLAWGTLVFLFILLVRTGAKATPKPPELLQIWELAASQDDLLCSATIRYALKTQRAWREHSTEAQAK